MNKKLIIPIITVGIAVIVLGVLILRRPNGSLENVANTGNAKNAAGQIICQDMVCLGNSFSSCTPAIFTMEGDNNGTPMSVTFSIGGIKDSKCSYEMGSGGQGVRCQFDVSALNDKVLNEMFGNDEGQAAVIAQSCTQF